MPASRIHLLALAAMLASGSGCGRHDAASAAVADQSRPAVDQAGLDCPAEVRKNLAGPDIVGLKLGMTLAEALGTARCALGADAQVKPEKQWLDPLDTYGIELGTQSFTVKKGANHPCNYQKEWQKCDGTIRWERTDEIVTVATPGAPGHETAMAIWRTQNFGDGRMPAVQTLVDALIAKYGPPQRTQDSNQPNGYTAGYRELEWVQDRRGAPLADPNPLYSQCLGAVHGYGEQTDVRWRDGCGLNIWARISLSGNNPGLAMQFDSAMVRQSDLYAHAEATQNELRQLGQTRRDAEVKQAQGASDVHL